VVEKTFEGVNGIYSALLSRAGFWLLADSRYVEITALKIVTNGSIKYWYTFFSRTFTFWIDVWTLRFSKRYQFWYLHGYFNRSWLLILVVHFCPAVEWILHSDFSFLHEESDVKSCFNTFCLLFKLFHSLFIDNLRIFCWIPKRIESGERYLVQCKIRIHDWEKKKMGDEDEEYYDTTSSLYKKIYFNQK
jgi:hypothetical protein